jgi:hypothetical protein
LYLNYHYFLKNPKTLMYQQFRLTLTNLNYLKYLLYLKFHLNPNYPNYLNYLKNR